MVLSYETWRSPEYVIIVVNLVYVVIREDSSEQSYFYYVNIINLSERNLLLVLQSTVHGDLKSSCIVL